MVISWSMSNALYLFRNFARGENCYIIYITLASFSYHEIQLSMRLHEYYNPSVRGVMQMCEDPPLISHQSYNVLQLKRVFYGKMPPRE